MKTNNNVYYIINKMKICAYNVVLTLQENECYIRDQHHRIK
jgi:uncharacterized protein (DUF1015 family)